VGTLEDQREQMLEWRQKGLEEALAKKNIPVYMRKPLVVYLIDGYRPGGFLAAVISNNFKEVCGRADDTNRNFLVSYAYVMVHGLPAHAQGSDERYEKWIEMGGLRGFLTVGQEGMRDQ